MASARPLCSDSTVSAAPEIRIVSLEQLRPSPYNPRRISPAALKALEASLSRFGYVEPVVWNQRSGFVVAGHQRLRLLRRQKRQDVPVVVVDLCDEDERLLNVTLNSDTVRGEFTADLQTLLDDIAATRAALYADLRLDELRSQIEVNRPSTGDVDEVPTRPKVPVTKAGDLWHLGPHKLLCADCADPAAWATLLDSSRANLVVTSPPYASQRDYDPSSGFRPVSADRYVSWFSTIVDRVAEHLADDGSFLLNLKENCESGARVLYVKELVLHMCRDRGWRFVDEFAWVHGGTPKTPAGRFKNGFEPVFHFARSAKIKFRPRAVRHESSSVPDWRGLHPSQGDGRRMHNMNNKASTGDHIWGPGRDHNAPGFAYPSNVIDFVGKNREALEHGAVFPVGLAEFFIRAFSDQGDVVVDPFAGAGTTLIAAEVNKRVGYGIEISPAYCDVIVERWQRLSGGTARRAA